MWAEADYGARRARRSRKAREREFRVDFRERVRVVSNQLGRFEPCDRCSIESAASRRAGESVPKRERFPRRAELEAERPIYPRPASRNSTYACGGIGRSWMIIQLRPKRSRS